MAAGLQPEYPLRICQLFWSVANIMHINVAWDDEPILLMATERIEGRLSESFQWAEGPAYDRQKIQMGLHKGNTALVHFRRGIVLYQSVLIMMEAELKPAEKPAKGQHKYWRYVSPSRTHT